ncbi:BirA family transcriptional regulator, biotin operon repressor / biotin-[acetyl-CoA-carboxylase] ligase [Alkalithermobacter thermoalcaliphilus JW-YL-7 = DSM 7308]|uniref:Bifunctional ligase/repressor BirA n=1 Tax=Alkalithermobacter thermoalcaliphilus JW-YL-7 = DSM 7308 TaxID=1121328 RepID=A0A150FMQ9_CLOPD|nr:BirA bifunctional protein, biotin operon repressor and biotin/acetyl-CoA-carboxylase ligase [[Clostridium] paradoxum JW-YL-7 = DSM 7308]SHL31280.1 BirA family transcriptional regulator, biotin operon repressor / biotin-[acetyl-CoA-carboxylase] ligase [[Clostridium] paradoxum JW-YL-7 = DSM 7308]
MKEKTLKILLENKGEFISGEYISEKLNISRSAVWKHIKAIKDEGYAIESVTKKGYKLIDYPDVMESEIIKSKLKTNIIGKEIIYFETIDSTNDYAKKIAKKSSEGTIVISEEQTKGKGRMGRFWHSSKKDGIYMSIILKPDILPNDAPIITQIAGLSVVKALNKLNVDAKIKWPNDILINNKKVCGILTEMSIEIDRIDYIVLGIGINVKTLDFSEDIKNIATSILKEGYNLNRLDIITLVLDEFENLYLDYINTKNKQIIANMCKEYSALIGKDIYVIQFNDRKRAKCIDINKEGNLIVQYEDGSIKELISGEVSIRGESEYV